jgi:hypothetical protein
MSWQNRLQQMVLAGGVLFTGCSNDKLAAGGGGGAGGTFVGGGCGNANPDPCICGRPEASSEAAAECQGEIACMARGGVWFPFTNVDATGTHPPYCQIDGGSDGDASVDGRSDGNAAD